MRLYVEKGNKEIRLVDNYSTTNPGASTIEVEKYNVEYEGFIVEAHANDTDNPTFTMWDVLPGKIGETCSMTFDIDILAGISMGYSIKFYNGSTLVNDYSTTGVMNNTFTFTIEDPNIKVVFDVTGTLGFRLSHVSFVLANKKEVNILNAKKMALTKQIKDFGNIGDVKGSYSNNIVIQYDRNNIDNLGYYAPNSEADVMKLVNGVHAVIATDENNIIADGTLTIKNIIRRENSYIVNLFFTDSNSSFFNLLSTDKIELPNEFIINNWDVKDHDQSKKNDNFEIDNDFFVYGYLDHNYVLEKDDINRQWAPNFGTFMYNISEIGGPTGAVSMSSINSIKNKVPFSEGYGNFPIEAEPLVRIKPLFKSIHDKYGYEMKGEIFNDPAFYNMVTNLTSPDNFNLNDVEPDPVDDIVFSNWLEITSSMSNKQGILLKPTTSNPSLYSTVHRSNNDNGTYIYYETYQNTPLTRLFGDTIWHDVYDLYNYVEGIHINKSFKTKMKVKIEIELTYETCSSCSDYIRFAIVDGIYSENGRRLTGNPFSFAMVDEIYFEGHANPESLKWERELVVDSINFDRLGSMNDAYFIRVFLLDEVPIPGAYPMHFEVKVTLSELKPSYDFQFNNHYTLDERNISFSEKDLFKDIINRFNLIPIVDSANKTITYHTFDEFYLNDNKELNWDNERIVMYDKDIKYDFSPKGIVNQYNFKLDVKESNSDLNDYNSTHEEDYASKNIITNYAIDKDYTIENKIGNTFFTTTSNKFILNPDPNPADGLRGKLGKDGDIKDSSKYTLMLVRPNGTAIKIANEDIALYDGSALDSSKTEYNSKKITKSVIGYLTNPLGETHLINGLFTPMKQYYWRNRSIYTNYYNISTNGSAVPLKFPKMLAPFNELQSDWIVNTSNEQNNNGWYSVMGYSKMDVPTNVSINNDLYSMYYENQILNHNTEGSHGLELFVLLSEDEYANITMREKVIIDGQRYILRKISNYVPNEPTKVELLSWKFTGDYDNRMVFHYNRDGINGLFMMSPTPKPTLSLNDDNKISVPTMGDIFTLAIPTNHHYVGRKYRVKVKYDSQSSFDVISAYKNGKSGASIMITHSITPGTGEFEYEYIRETHDVNTPMTVLTESLKIQAMSSNASMKITGVEVYVE